MKRMIQEMRALKPPTSSVVESCTDGSLRDSRITSAFRVLVRSRRFKNSISGSDGIFSAAPRLRHLGRQRYFEPSLMGPYETSCVLAAVDGSANTNISSNTSMAGPLLPLSPLLLEYDNCGWVFNFPHSLNRPDRAGTTI